jgi:hypothetical protein
MKQRKQSSIRTDTTAGAVEMMRKAALTQHEWSPVVTRLQDKALRESANRIFANLQEARPHDLWRAHDLTIACMLANLTAEIDATDIVCRREGQLVNGGKLGTTKVANPRFSVLAQMQQRATTMTRQLSLFGVNIDPRQVNAQALAQREAKAVIHNAARHPLLA